MLTKAQTDAAMREAIALAQSPDAPRGVNPRVGCVIVAPDGRIIGRGHHRGAGTAHAEVDALADAGPAAAGATAVVTLEPCRHTGRTGPCTEALIAAGIASVVFGQVDPTTEAAGGADVLRAAGVHVVGGVLRDEAEAINAAWTFAEIHGRPLVTWKYATSLDGRVAGSNGGPTAITGDAARRCVHQLRSEVDAIVVGTGTALTDDPALTVRLEGVPAAAEHPPLRVVVGRRSLPTDARLRDDAAETLAITERDPRAVLAQLFDRGVRHVLLEGGPTLAAAFLSARLIDRIDVFLAPILLGAGPVALPPLVDAESEVDVESVSIVGDDVRVRGIVRYPTE